MYTGQQKSAEASPRQGHAPSVLLTAAEAGRAELGEAEQFLEVSAMTLLGLRPVGGAAKRVGSEIQEATTTTAAATTTTTTATTTTNDDADGGDRTTTTTTTGRRQRAEP